MSKTSQPLPDYVPCVECGFWVQRRARHCPDCGLRKPGKSRDWLLWKKDLVGALGGGLGGAVGGGVLGMMLAEEGDVNMTALCAFFCAVGGAYLGTLAKDSDEIVGLAVSLAVGGVVSRVVGRVVGGVVGRVVGGVVGMAVFWAVFWAVAEAVFWASKRRRPNSMRQREALLNERLWQIPRQVKQFLLRQQQLEQRQAEVRGQGRSTERLARGAQAMEQAQVALKQHAERLRLLLQAIALRRWQNGLIPFVVGLQTGHGDESQVEALKKHTEEGRRALRDAPSGVQEKWRDLIDRAERLHDEWLLQLATADVRRVRPLEEDSLRDLVEPLLEELDLEDPTLAWGEEWDELEEEYRRLTGEMEAVEEVEQLVCGA